MTATTTTVLALPPHACEAAGSGVRLYRLCAGRDDVTVCERCRKPILITAGDQKRPASPPRMGDTA